MKIGVPKETKKQEYRVALLPSGANVLTENNHEVFIQSSAGEGSGFSDSDYAENGAKILDSAEQIYRESELILKVKDRVPMAYISNRQERLLRK